MITLHPVFVMQPDGDRNNDIAERPNGVSLADRPSMTAPEQNHYLANGYWLTAQ